MLEFMQKEHMEVCSNKLLIEYKQALDAYRKKLLQHVYDYRDTHALLLRVLKERQENLELELMFAEDDRLAEESSVLYTPDFVH